MLRSLLYYCGSSLLRSLIGLSVAVNDGLGSGLGILLGSGSLLLGLLLTVNYGESLTLSSVLILQVFLIKSLLVLGIITCGRDLLRSLRRLLGSGSFSGSYVGLGIGMLGLGLLSGGSLFSLSLLVSGLILESLLLGLLILLFIVCTCGCFLFGKGLGSGCIVNRCYGSCNGHVICSGSICCCSLDHDCGSLTLIITLCCLESLKSRLLFLSSRKESRCLLDAGINGLAADGS